MERWHWYVGWFNRSIFAGKIVQGKKTGIDEVTVVNKELFPISKSKDSAFKNAETNFKKEVAKN